MCGNDQQAVCLFYWVIPIVYLYSFCYVVAVLQKLLVLEPLSELEPDAKVHLTMPTLHRITIQTCNTEHMQQISTPQKHSPLTQV